MRNFEEIISDLHKISETQTENLYEAFVLVRETMSGLLDVIREKVAGLMIARDMHEAGVLLALANEMTEMEKDISARIIAFESVLEDEDAPQEPDVSAADFEQKMERVGVPKSLRETFTFTTPCGMRLTRNVVIQAKNWRGLFLRFCEALYDMNPQLFESFSSLSEMNGRSRPHFSTSRTGFRSIGSIYGKMFVEMNMSANGFRDLMMKCMKAYKLPVDGALVYIRNSNKHE